jgi:hypothetical protein
MDANKLRIVARNLIEVQDELESMWDELEDADPDVNRLRSLLSEAQATVFVTERRKGSGLVGTAELTGPTVGQVAQCQGTTPDRGYPLRRARENRPS